MKSGQSIKHLVLLVLLLIFVVMPLLVLGIMDDIAPQVVGLWFAPRYMDYFNYVKAIVVNLVGALSLVVLGLGHVSKEKVLKWDGVTVITLLLSILVGLSTFLSPYFETAMWGFPNRFEGGLTWLSYLAIFTLVRHYGYPLLNARWLWKAALGTSVVISVIGLFQHLELDLFKHPVVLEVITPFDQVSQYTTSFSDQKSTSGAIQAYGTLYNPNVLGLYMAVFVVGIAGVCLQIKDRVRALPWLAYVFLFTGLLVSFSRGAYLAAGLGLLSLVVVYAWQGRLNIKAVGSLVILSACLVLAINTTSQGDLLGKINEMGTQQTHFEDSQIDKIKDFNMKGHQLEVVTTHSLLRVDTSQGTWHFTDEKGQALGLIQGDKPKEYLLEDPAYKGVTLTIVDYVLKIKKGKSALYFGIAQDGFVVLNRDGKPLEDYAAPSLGFKGLERIGSGRGYIWSRSLPLLSDTVVWGKGPDTFALVFPQYDLKGKLNHMYDGHLVIDKAHNAYIQVGIQLGLLALLLLLVLATSGLLKTLRYRRQEQLILLPLALSMLVGFCFVDLSVHLGPLLWTILGLLHLKATA